MYIYFLLIFVGGFNFRVDLDLDFLFLVLFFLNFFWGGGVCMYKLIILWGLVGVDLFVVYFLFIKL